MSDHNDAVRDETEPQITAPETTEAGAVFDQRRVDRRRLLGTAAATGAAAAVIPLTLVAVEAQDSGGAATPEATPMGHDHMDMPVGPPTNEGFTYFVPYQAAIIQAAAARIIPTDELGPGATEAGVVLFIDRQINKGANMGFRGPRYSMGPFLNGEPTQGDQSGMNIRDQFRVGIFALDAYAQTTFGQGFVACTAEQQDQLLTDLSEGRPENFASGIQSQPISQGGQLTPNLSLEATLTSSFGATAFFTMLRNWTMAGFFSDPVQGGNHDMVGWKMIGFPGAHISYFEEIENYNVPFEGEYISLGQYQEQMGGGL